MHSLFPRLIARIARWCLAGIVAAFLGLSGCAGVDNSARETKPRDDELSNMARRFRPPDPSASQAGWSDKANEIEKDLGVSR